MDIEKELTDKLNPLIQEMEDYLFCLNLRLEMV